MQASYFGSITTDLLQYISHITVPGDRADGGFEELVGFYHKHLEATAVKLGIPQEDVVNLDELRYDGEFPRRMKTL